MDLQSLRLISHLGIIDLISEDDSFIVIDVICYKDPYPSRQGNLIAEIQCLLLHIGRQRNEVAHLTCFAYLADITFAMVASLS